MSFARPLLLLALLVLPLWWWFRARRLRTVPGTRASDLRPAVVPGQRFWIARLPVTLRSVCLAAWIVAAAGVRIGGGRAEVRSEGISIVLAVDISSSMLAEDFAPNNRLDVAKRTATAFVRARASDQIGLVAFAGQALTLVPLTTDHAVLEEALARLQIGTIEDGTAIGTGLATAANRLRRTPGKSRVIVLLTDGVNNKGTVDPRTAGAAAATFGIRVYAIGVGREGEAPVPTGQGLGGLRYQMMPVQIDEALLRDVTAKTGGRYFRAQDAASLARIFGEIDRLEKSLVQRVVYRRRDEAFRWPLGIGLFALVLELALAGSVAVRVP
jgi:Ca-activated chloride channel family protein